VASGAGLEPGDPRGGPWRRTDEMGIALPEVRVNPEAILTPILRRGEVFDKSCIVGKENPPGQYHS
jgi:hypothetical protein